MSNLMMAFILTSIAGLATGFGALIAFCAKRTNFRFLSVSTGLSAGVMLYVSFVELFPSATLEIAKAGYGHRLSSFYSVLGFFGGIALIFLIDRLVPDAENPHEVHPESEYTELHNTAKVSAPTNHQRLLRMGIFTAIAITIHNFPEGLATFLTTLENPKLGIAIAFAIALHNIPEGISVSVPIYYATGSRKKAFIWSCLSGFAEPVGALVIWSLLALIYRSTVFSPPPVFLGIVSSMVAGIMVFISLDELLPASRAYGKGHDSLYGLVAGMAIMALSLILL
ncbi:MAG: zinc transporter ZupT [Kiritimatiellia bacterium]